MTSRRQILKKWASILLLLVAAIPLWACGQTFEVTITVQGTVATGRVIIDGELRTFEGVVGQDGCVSWSIDGCEGRVCGCQSGSQFKVTCKDPLLAEWPTGWTPTSATWSAPDLGLAGDILVTPASSWVLPPEFGVIVTDPGYSAWVLKLDAPGDLGPTMFELELVFDVGAPPLPGCMKGIDIATAESPIGLWGPFIVPTDPAMGVDFTVFHDGDPNVFCIDPGTPAEQSTWGRLKSYFR
jgi:hypothetical protein